MAKATTQANANHVPHVDIGLQFGKPKSIEFIFAQRDKNWSCLRKDAGNTDRSEGDSERDQTAEHGEVDRD